MGNYVVLDAGGTKIKYIYSLDSTVSEPIATSSGVVPYLLAEDEISAVLKGQLDPALLANAGAVQTIIWYGSGCDTTEHQKKIAGVLRTIFSVAKITVLHDMVGAARSLCQREKGIASIMGTGSSCCAYGGDQIEYLRAGIGYILGDEGGGAHIGGLCLQCVFYGKISKELTQQFYDFVGKTPADIIRQVYLSPNPNRFIASVVRFVREHRSEPEMERIVRLSIGEFFDNHILYVHQKYQYPLYFVGGVAYSFADEVRAFAQKHGLEVKRILRDPVEGMVAFHQNRGDI